MGNGKLCDCCMEVTSLLQSYDSKRGPLNSVQDINISREEVETIFLYMQSWTQRQCSCCFRDNRNFERFNWAIQIFIIVVVEIIRNGEKCLTSVNQQRLLDKSDESINLDETVVMKEAGNEENDPEEEEEDRMRVMCIEEKDKLIHFVSKVFMNNFPTYVAYKQHIQVKNEEITPQEIQGFGQFCEIHEPETSPYLFRNVLLFCKINGMDYVTKFLGSQNPETLQLTQTNLLVALVTNLKTWFNFQTLLKYYVPFRSAVLSYMCKLVDTELKTASARNMAEYIWGAVKDPMDAHINFDRDGLELAFKYFLSTTLTMRLAGVNQINNHINLFNEIINSDHIPNTENLDQFLSKWLLEKQLIHHIFGPNLHVEVIKQSHTILTFLAMEGKISNEDIDTMWQAAQLKHCSKQVYDIMSSLIGNMDHAPVLHLHSLLCKLEPKDHTEQSLYLASALIKFIWANATTTMESLPVTTTLGTKFRRRTTARVMEPSSSENSVSVEASHSEDEMQVTAADSSDEESISGAESGKSDEAENLQINSSGAYVETHSDSDADEEHSGIDDSVPAKKAKRKILRRKKPSIKGTLSGKEGANSLPVFECNVKIQIDENAKPEDGATPSGTTSAELLEPNAVISELSNLVQMTDAAIIPGFPNAPTLSRETLESLGDASDGSYSSRISTKSEKNMADFDGEDSPCEDEIMQSLTPNQLAELTSHHRQGLRVGGVPPVFSPRSVRPYPGRNRRKTPAASSFTFSLEDVCKPGQTLLWDLIQDDKITLLADGLAVEAQKALNNLLCFNTDKRIRLKFIEGCLENLTINRSVVVSLRLLPKLLTSFQQTRLTGEIHEVTMWAENKHNMMTKFFDNLQAFKSSESNPSPFPFHVNVQVRLEFLSVVFSFLGSPAEFLLSIEQIDHLWHCLATDHRSSDDFFIWLTGQVRLRDQHSLSFDAVRHIFLLKMPSLPPETITMHGLTLFQQLCSMARTHVDEDAEAAASSMHYLWKIALCAQNTDVSMTAIQYLNGYYISRQLEKEEEFVQRCMSHLAEATEELTHCKPSDETPLLRIQRALLLLKTHLETFRRRYAYHLRKWRLEGNGIGSHAQLVGEKGAVSIRIVIQPAGYHEKVTLELLSSDYVADLRAEVAKWWETIQGNLAMDKTMSTPVLGSLLTEGPIRMITQGIELSAEYDEKLLSEVPIKDMQLVYVSMGASRPQKKKDPLEYSSSLPPPPRDKLPVALLLQPQYFEQLFSLMQSLSSIKIQESSHGSIPHTKAQVLSRRVWDILMLLPTNPAIDEGFKTIRLEGEKTSFEGLLDPSSPQKLMYSLYIVESLVKVNLNRRECSGSDGETVEPNAWRQNFIECGGLFHLFDIFVSGVLESADGSDWSEWKQDCLAALLKILCYTGVMHEDIDCLNEQLYDVNEAPRKRAKKRKVSSEKVTVPRLNDKMLSMMNVEMVMTRLSNILQACSTPRDPNCYKTGFWGRAQVVHYAMALLVCWAFSCEEIRSSLYAQKDFSQWLRRLVLEDPEPAVRREVCTGLYRLCLGVSHKGKYGITFAPELISHLLKCLSASLSLKPQQRFDVPQHYDDGKEPYGPACRDYYWLLCRLLDCLSEEFVKESIENPDNYPIDLDGLACKLSKYIVGREYYETRHNTVTDDALVGLLNTITVVMKHNPPFKGGKNGQQFVSDIFDCLFALPSPMKRYLPKCKAQVTRQAAYDLLTEMCKGAVQNYYLLQDLLMNQHQPGSHAPYPWDYWPHDDGRASCGYVGLTNLGATCYMASCMQHLYMMPQARASILGAQFNSEVKHEQTLRELQRMFAYLMESERKAYNPRSFCKVYQMDHQPLNTGEQKDMTEFFIDLVSKLEDMTPELKKLVKTLFCGVTSNNVVSLDCPHVSRTLEEFYTVRCQVADMRNLYESLDEVTVKDTLEGDNMYTCSQCGKKVRAEKRACFKKLPQILCFNTMRYTFNMITMMKEKVNTHFSFPLHLDMSGYVEKTLMPQQHSEERIKRQIKEEDLENIGSLDDFGLEIEEDECYEYDLIGVTVHTGTADGGHYYSFIRDRSGANKDKWFLFNDAEVKAFDPNQLAAECFGGEMSTKTYDSVTDKFMDFSFEKTNSAYMLFYERCSASPSQIPGVNDSSLVPALPGGSSQRHASAQAPVPITVELNKELEDWIWQDNTNFLRDKNIFEHTYFNFMWQACGSISQSLVTHEDVMLMAAKLSVTFFLETFIHAKEKPTMVQWVELITKQLSASLTAPAWLLDHMAESDWWPVQILLKCPNQMVRQMFQRLCIHVITQLRPKQLHLYLKYPEGQASDHPDDVKKDEFGSYSCVTRFIKKLLTLLEHGAKSHLKHLTEYFTFLHDFSKMGDEECLFLINIQAISSMVNFYLGKKEDSHGEHCSDEEEEEEEIVTIPAEKNKVASLEKMIALVAILVEKSRDDANALKLSVNDWNALTGSGKGFPFIMQQIRDGINLTNTRNLIFSLCRWNGDLAENIVIGIFQAIQKHPDVCHPFFKVLNLLAEMVAVPPGMPSFTELILRRILDVAELCPYPTLEWLAAQVPKNKLVNTWCLSTMDTWVEHYLISHNNGRVRNAAASLLVSLVPNHYFRQGYRGTKFFGHSKEMIALTNDAQMILHEIYTRLLRLLKPARHYTDNIHGTSKLTAYFAVLSYFTISKAEKLMFGPYFLDLWNLFHPRLSEPCIAVHQNKQALLAYWHNVCLDCLENVHKIVSNSNVTKHIGFNYILADHEDQEVVMFNRTMLPQYYAILRMCCQTSRHFALHLSRHQNITWAFKNISPYPNQYPAAVDELFKMMQIFVSKPSDASDQEISEITVFKRQTLQLYLSILDGRANWSTLITACRILLENIEDRFIAVQHNVIHLMFEAFIMLHNMHHEATACHVTVELVELLNLLTEVLRVFRPKEYQQGQQIFPGVEPQIVRFILNSKDWPEVLRRLLTLLNTYNSADVRTAVLDTLTEFLYILPAECIRILVPLMLHCHSSSQDPHSSNMGPALGPYFPRRSAHGGVTIKPAVRPPRPMLQMAFPQYNQELIKGADDEYDRQVQEFYTQYHGLVDLMCRIAFMKDYMNQELVSLSAMVGYEAAPLQWTQFPKLWVEVYNTPTLDRKYISMLVNQSVFRDYIVLVLLDERPSLANQIIFNFVAAYLPRIYESISQIDSILKMVDHMLRDFRVIINKQMVEIDVIVGRIIGDLRALSLLYIPSYTGKAHTRDPLGPRGAPSKDVFKTLRSMKLYLESLTKKSRETGEAPSKKRKLDSGSDDKERLPTSDESAKPTPSSSSRPQNVIQDYINLIVTTIDEILKILGPLAQQPDGLTKECDDLRNSSTSTVSNSSVDTEETEKMSITEESPQLDDDREKESPTKETSKEEAPESEASEETIIVVSKVESLSTTVMEGEGENDSGGEEKENRGGPGDP